LRKEVIMVRSVRAGVSLALITAGALVTLLLGGAVSASTIVTTVLQARDERREPGRYGLHGSHRVINQFTSYSFSSAYNVTYSEAVSVLGSLPVLGMNLIVDSGFAGDEDVDLTNATVGVGGATPYTQTFTPQPASATAPTCDLPTNATIKITKTSGTPTGDVNEPISIQPNDTNNTFRVVDCKLMYNLATSSLSGVGTYTVSAVINGTAASNPAVFDLR
jgi:hypothetical protein